MIFRWFALQSALNLDTTIPTWGYPLIAAYILGALALLIYARHDFESIKLNQWLLVAGLMFGGVLLPLVLIITVSGVDFAVFTLLTIVAAALILGRVPALLVGLGIGIGQAVFVTGRLTHPFELAIFGFVLATLLHQRYQGIYGSLLRRPTISTLLITIFVLWPLSLLGIFATGDLSALVSLEQTVALMLPLLALLLVGALISGGITDLVLLRWPQISPDREKKLLTPPWEQHLSSRFLVTLIPLLLASIVLLVGIVSGTAYRVATRLVLDQMVRDATTASTGIPFYVQVGRGLIRDLANDEQLINGDEDARQSSLASGLRTVPFFQELAYFDAEGVLISAYPASTSTAFSLYSEEQNRVQAALQNDFASELVVNDTATAGVVMSFVTSAHAADGSVQGVLLGRTALDSNPILLPVIETLREGFVKSGEGFIVDDQNRILLYPAHPERQQQVFEPGEVQEITNFAAEGQTFRQFSTDGTRELIYILPIAGQSDWSIVVTVPNEVALDLAVRIAFPVMLVLLLLSGIAIPIVIAITNRISDPLEELLQGTELISQGQLDRPVQVSGEDEIGRLGATFEQMRLRLKGRISEQDRLLNISRSVSASLELFRAVPPILSSALEVTNAIGVRMVLQAGENMPLQTYAAGDAAAAMSVLDAQLVKLVEQQGTVVISQIWRAAGSLDVSALPSRIQALVALPLRSDTTYHGMLWLAYDKERIFEQSEMNFLTTLSGQAAVAVTNARLFSAAEEGRRKLEAVLESTTDGLIVTDTEGRVALMNPAAEDYFAVRDEHARGQSVSSVIVLPELARLLTDLKEPVASLELPGQNGRTLLANTSTVVGQDGKIAGRVVVLRDITVLKELDSLKTVFLRMVSHDLRSPLTYIGGYLSMLPLSGDLNTKQNEAIVKIKIGVAQIQEMTERLTHLSRLQFGDKAELDLVLLDMNQTLKEVELQYVDRANDKQLDFKFDVEPQLPLILADAILCRHAIANLVGNAVKYTPEKGKIVVSGRVEADQIVIAVKDNGMGIREKDQKRLYEAFYRVPQYEGEAARPPGSGLGLALVRAIAESHGGKVWFESEYEKGSTFYMGLPLKSVNTDFLLN